MHRFRLILADLRGWLFRPWRAGRYDTTRRQKVGLPVAVVAAFWVTASSYLSGAAVVYDDTTGPYVIMSVGEAGDTVTLAGTERFVTAISIGVVCNGNNPVSDDQFQMKLWTADGPGGTAGTLLWQGSYTNIALNGPLQLITFDVPLIPVPDTLIWDVSHTDSGNVFFQWSNPVTIGSSPDYAWIYLTEQVQSMYGVPANFMAQIEAISQPGLAETMNTATQPQVQLSWPTNADGFALETASSLPGLSWITVTNVPIVLGSNYSLTLSATNAQQYFRLHR